MTSPPPKPSTARRGDPSNATRGAAVRRAKLDLAAAIDVKLSYDREAAELALLGKVLGLSDVGQVRGRLERATLGELVAWTNAMQVM